MISGSRTLSSLERAILELRSEENRVASLLQAASEDVLRLRAQQAENFKALAEIELDALARKNVVGELDGVRRRALEMLAHCRQKLEQAAAARVKATEEASTAEAEHARAAATVEAAVNQIRELSARVEESAKSDPEWIAMQQRATQAEATAKAALQKAARSEADREAKRKPYESDSLFMYLWKCGYGTAAYRGGAIRRYFDGKVAKLVGYDTARVNYHMLAEIPLRLREHANRLAEEGKAALANRTAIERRALEAAGIGKFEKDFAAVQDALKQAETRLAKANAQLKTFDPHQNLDAVNRNDPEYRQAIEMLAEGLRREDVATLYQRALATPSPVDDRIVSALQQNEQAIGKAEAQVQSLRATFGSIAHKRAELEQSRGRYYQAGYNNPMGGFINGAVIGSILGGILNGTRGSGGLDDIFRQGWRGPHSGGFGGGFNFPGGGSWGNNNGSSGDSGGSWGGGGDSGSGGFDSGGGFGGGDGGFQTGGGF